MLPCHGDLLQTLRYPESTLFPSKESLMKKNLFGQLWNLSRLYMGTCTWVINTRLTTNYKATKSLGFFHVIMGILTTYALYTIFFICVYQIKWFLLSVDEKESLSNDYSATFFIQSIDLLFDSHSQCKLYSYVHITMFPGLLIVYIV